MELVAGLEASMLSGSSLGGWFASTGWRVLVRFWPWRRRRVGCKVEAFKIREQVGQRVRFGQWPRPCELAMNAGIPWSYRRGLGRNKEVKSRGRGGSGFTVSVLLVWMLRR